MPTEFSEQLTAILPRMHVWALALTRNRAAADDLTQDVAAKALSAQDSFEMGTNLQAWLHRIMFNHFISDTRIRKRFSEADEIPELPVASSQEDRTALQELSKAVKQLPRDQREALVMISLEGASYETAAARTGCNIGTLKSRVHRARLQLRSYMLGGPMVSPAADSASP